MDNIFRLNLQDDNQNNTMRADLFVAQCLKISRTKAQDSITKGRFLLNGKPLLKSNILLKHGDILKYQILKDSTQITKTLDTTLEIPILYEDEDLLILNKPTNLIVHRTNTEDSQFTLVDYLQNKDFSLSNLGDSYRAGIVHRLDKNTSGAIVIAKNNSTHIALSEQIKARQMGRYYFCVIDKPLKESKLINLPLMRHPKQRLKYITSTQNNPNAKPAKTAFFEITTQNHLALIGAKLFSGRTHQIRVHLSAINRHILGDGFYGYAGNYQGRILLHAHFIHLYHPKTQTPLTFYAQSPKELHNFLQTNFNLESYLQNGIFTFPLQELYNQNFPHI